MTIYRITELPKNVGTVYFWPMQEILLYIMFSGNLPDLRHNHGGIAATVARVDCCESAEVP